MTDFLKTLIEVSVSVSVVAVLLMLLEPLLRKRFAAGWRCLVWGLLALRLLIPVNFHFSLPPVQVTVPAAASASVRSVQTEPLPASAGSAPAAAVPVVPDGNPEQVLFAVWAAGAVCILAWRFAAYFAFLRKVRKTGAQDQCFRTREAFRSALEGVRLKETPPVMRCGGLPSPMTAGFFHPFILLPDTNYTGEELEMIFRHELSHIVRRDVWFKLLLSCANAAHWFNPPVWLMARKAGEDAELACDSAVVDGMDEEFRRRYGEAILSSVRKGRAGTVFSTAFGGGAKSMKRRIRNLLDKGKKHRGVAALCAVLLAAGVLGASFAFGASAKSGPLRETQQGGTSMVNFHSVDSSGFQNTTVGAVMPEIDYASPSRIIFHSWFGLFVYDLPNKEILSSVNLQELGYGNMQGSPCTEVSVSGDGKTVCLHNIGGADEAEMLRYNADANTMEKAAFQKLLDAYAPGDSSENPLSGWPYAVSATYGVMETSGQREKRVYIVTKGENAGDLELMVCEAGQDAAKGEVIPIFSGSGAGKTSSRAETQSLQTADYTLNSIPSDWKVETLPDGESLTFRENGKEIGSLSVLSYDPKQPISQFEGNHAETLSTKTVGGLGYSAAEAVIRRTQPAAAGGSSSFDELHVYLIPGNGAAYDLCFDSSKVTEKTALRIAGAFRLNGTEP